MVSCAVSGCSNRTGRDHVGFYRVPKIIWNQCDRTRQLSEKRRNTWLDRIGRQESDVSSSGLHVCGAHFVTGHPSKLFEESSIDWAPSVSLAKRALSDDESSTNPDTKKPKIESTLEEGSGRLQQQTEKPEVKAEVTPPVKEESSETDAEQSSSSDSTSTSESEAQNNMDQNRGKELSKPPTDVTVRFPPRPQDQDSSSTSTEDDEVAVVVDGSSTKQSECQTELTTKDIFDLERNVSSMKSEMDTLRVKILDTELSEQAFQNNDGKVRFYTGFSSYALLMVAFNFVKVGLEPHSQMTLFQEFIMFMLRIRLNLPERGLAARFNVSEEAASRICERWLDAMYVRLGCIIDWPDREDLRRTVPPVLRQVLGDRAAVIVDCFELSIDRPSESLGQCTTWINYKNHNTVKFLIGITPQGMISFISEACGGKANNKYVTEHSGLLKNLLPGDVILADKGFGVAESVGFCCARVMPPGSPEQKKQLVAIEIHEMWKLVPLKGLVDQEVGAVRNKYHILQTCHPVEYLTCREGEDSSVIDKIVTVCCALTNLSKTIPSFEETC